MPYLACSSAKPPWTLMSELNPGNSVESSSCWNRSKSVRSASLKSAWADVRIFRSISYSQIFWVGALMCHDDCFQRGIIANVPCGTSKRIYRPIICQSHRTVCHLRRRPLLWAGIPDGLHSLLSTYKFPFSIVPRTMTGSYDSPPQSHLIVALGWQYAAPA